jgi:16S rRNA (cytosine1402-N4)-methyltransferase
VTALGEPQGGPRPAASVGEFAHVTVMRDEVLAALAQAQLEDADARVLVDATVGGGGHAAAVLEAFPDWRVLGLDRDAEAIAAAGARLLAFGARATLLQRRFGELAEVCAAVPGGRVGAVLADLGVSSFQLDQARRGFSFRAQGPLDMRMDAGSGQSALELLPTLDESTLAQIIRDLGEERYAKRVARAIFLHQPQDTLALAEVVRAVVPPSKDGLDPATRTFQALRMWVNDEQGELESLLAALPSVLADGGVAILISFHSLEDRAVKQSLRAAAKGCVCPPRLPMCACGRTPTLRLLSAKALRPSAAECARNPRARSAKLRAALRCRRDG